jgi:two-component system chemotaxis response regulator CheY
VDDSGIMRKMVMHSLMQSKLAQFIFTEASDGQDGLEKFDPKVHQMIFVDWNMPRLSGIDMVRQIRASQKQHVPIVMITTEGTMGKVEEALETGGVDGYVVKPFTVDVLVAKLEPLFDKLSAAQTQSKGFFGKLASKLG